MGSEGQTFDTKKVTQDLKANMTVANKMHGMKRLKNVFNGSDCVNALIKLEYAKNEKDAISVGHALMAEDVFYHIPRGGLSLGKKKDVGEVRKDDLFSNDTHELYKFLEDGDDRDPAGTMELPTEHGWVGSLWVDDKTLPSLKLHSEFPPPNENLIPQPPKKYPDREQVKKDLLNGNDVTSIGGISPIDDANTKLLENVYPLEWDLLPQPKDSYNLVVIGAGSAGLAAAELAASFGAKVAIIEKHLMGGDSFNFGTLPVKALQRSAKAAHQIKTASGFGIDVKDVNVDFAKVMERVRKLRAETSFRESATFFSDKLGVDVYFGKGEFVSHFQIRVGERVLEFQSCIISTGSVDALPKIQGITDIPYLTRREIFNLTSLPKRLAVLGGDSGAVEIAQALSRLGASEITFITRGKFVLQDHEDPRTQDVLTKILENDGVKVLTHCEIHRIVQNGDKETELYYSSGNKELSVTVDSVFVSVGKLPNVEGLNLDSAGIKYNMYTGIQVDEHLKTTNPKVYAIGDVCVHYRQEHAGVAHAKIAASNAIFQGNLSRYSILIPRTIYTEPEVAHVGLYEDDLKARQVPYEQYFNTMVENDRAIIDQEEYGFILVTKAKDSDRILGVTIVAQNADEMIGELTTATQYGIGLSKLSQVVHPYPTKSNVVGLCAEQYHQNKQTPMQKQLTKNYLMKQVKRQ